MLSVGLNPHVPPLKKTLTGMKYPNFYHYREHSIYELLTAENYKRTAPDSFTAQYIRITHGHNRKIQYQSNSISRSSR